MLEQDPFSNFLGDLTEKIKVAKEHKDIMEAVYTAASATEIVKEQEDPFASFLQKISNTIASKLPPKESINEPIVEITTQEPQAEAAVVLGEKLKQALEQIQDKKQISSVKELPQYTTPPSTPIEEEVDAPNARTLAQKIRDAIDQAKQKALEQPAAREEQLSAKLEEPEDNQIADYIQELEKIKDTGTVEQKEEATTSLKELKKYIDKTVQDYARRILDLGSGGGSVAVQYAKGGTMDGNLSVNNLYPNNNGELGSPGNRWDRIYVNNIDALSSNMVIELSGFYTSGDLTVNGVVSSLGGNSNQWNSNWSTTNSNSGNWESNYTSFNTNSGNYDSVYTTTNSNSGNWSSVYSTVRSLSNDWEESAEILPTVTNYLSTNNVLLSSLTIRGDIIGSTIQNVFNTGSSTINAFGAATTLNIGNWNTSSLIIGGPIVTAASQTIDIGPANTNFGNTKTINIGRNSVVGATVINIGSQFESYGLGATNRTTIYGLVSTTGTIYAPSGNSMQWNAAHTTTQVNSGSWSSVYNTYKSLSASYAAETLAIAYAVAL